MDQCFEWKIDNFSLWNLEVHGPSIRSPAFFGSIVFELCPMGQKGHGKRMLVSIFPKPPSGELCILGSDETMLSSQSVSHPKEGDKITVRLPEYEKVLAFLKNKGDRLTLRYQINSIDVCKQILCTLIDVFDTTIKINPCALVYGEEIFHFVYDHQKKDYLVRLGSGKNGSETGLVLSNTDVVDRVIFVRTCINFLKGGDVLEECQRNEHVFFDHKPWMFFSVDVEELKSKRKEILLHLRVISGGMSHSQWGAALSTKRACIASNSCSCIAEQRPSPVVPSNPMTPSDDSLVALSKELRCLFQDRGFSDFLVRCEGVSFPVHRAVLSARSPVFKRLLCSDMREAASGSVDIEDLDAPTLARFLAFLYTGSVEDLRGDSALKLYYAADKYEVPTLKKVCVECLCADISVTNICDILSLAVKHGDDQLIEMSRNFISENHKEVLKLEKWNIFMYKEPLLVAQTLTLLGQEDSML